MQTIEHNPIHAPQSPTCKFLMAFLLPFLIGRSRQRENTCRLLHGAKSAGVRRPKQGADNELSPHTLGGGCFGVPWGPHSGSICCVQAVEDKGTLEAEPHAGMTRAGKRHEGQLD